MQQEIVARMLKNFEECAHEKDGVEFWFARDVQILLGYVEWRKFQGVLEKAKEACTNSGNNPSDHFVGVAKMVPIGSSAEQKIENLL